MSAASQEAGKTGGFGRSDRMLRPAEFEAVYSRGGRAGGKLFRVVAASRDGAGEKSSTRLGLSVGKRFGNSPERNRAKRRIREAFRIVRGELPKAVDLIVIPSRPVLDAPFGDVKSALVELGRMAAGRQRLPDKKGGS